MDNINIIKMENKYLNSYYHAVNEINQEIKYLPSIYKYSLSETKQLVLNKINNNIPFLILVKENTVIGWCYTDIYNSEKLLLSIGIIKKYRNLGYGKKLIKKISLLSKTQGFKYLCIQVTKSNKGAIHIYKSLHFKIYNIIKNNFINTYYKDDILEMVLALF